MFGLLLESRARRHRRSGGAAFSVATHLAIIGIATAATVPAKSPLPQPVEVVRLPLMPAPKQPARIPVHRASANPATHSLSTIEIPRIPIPVFSRDLPPIDLVRGPSLDSMLRVSAGPASGTGATRAGLGRFDLAAPESGGRVWRDSELLMRIVSSAKPRYPESLRQLGLGGRVVVQFVVDTTGRVEPASVRIVTSSHELFTRSVREILPIFRFKPAEASGRLVRALAEMPFEFTIAR